MAAAGLMDRRCRFERRDATADDYGNVTAGGWVALATVWGRLTERPGRESVEAGRLESSAAGTLTIRDSVAARGVTAADRVVIDGAEYAIRDVRPPQRIGLIEMVVERGVAP
jgi:SPP1 family predicted phage head-tail adaptor